MAEFWIKQSEQVFGPANMDAIKKLLAENRITAQHLFAESPSGPWFKIAEVPALSIFARDMNGWYWIKSGFISDSQKGPVVGSQILQALDNKKLKTDTPVLHSLFTDNQWKHLSSTPLNLIYKMILKRREVERQRQIAIEDERRRKEAEQEQQRQEALHRQKQEANRQAALEQRRQVEMLQREEQVHQARVATYSPETRRWITAAESEDFWVRKDYYYLRGYLELYCVSYLDNARVQALLHDVEVSDNFLEMKWITLTALFEVCRLVYPQSNAAETAIAQVEETNVWNGKTCFTLEAIFRQVVAARPEYGRLAEQEYENRHRHDAWLCAIYYTIRAVIIKRIGPLENNPRIQNHFNNAEADYDVWQALVSNAIIALIEVDLLVDSASQPPPII